MTHNVVALQAVLALALSHCPTLRSPFWTCEANSQDGLCAVTSHFTLGGDCGHSWDPSLNLNEPGQLQHFQSSKMACHGQYLASHTERGEKENEGKKVEQTKIFILYVSLFHVWKAK